MVHLRLHHFLKLGRPLFGTQVVSPSDHGVQIGETLVVWQVLGRMTPMNGQHMHPKHPAPS
jgi:hypothetical protein